MFEKIMSSLLPQKFHFIGQELNCSPQVIQQEEVTVDKEKKLTEGMQYYYGCSSVKELNRAAAKSGIAAQYLLKIAGGENMNE